MHGKKAASFRCFRLADYVVSPSIQNLLYPPQIFGPLLFPHNSRLVNQNGFNLDPLIFKIIVFEFFQLGSVMLLFEHFYDMFIFFMFFSQVLSLLGEYKFVSPKNEYNLSYFTQMAWANTDRIGRLIFKTFIFLCNRFL